MAFTRLWEELSPIVAGYVRGRGVRDCDDVTSEVFLAVFRGLGNFDGDGSSFRRWLFTIAHHRAVDALRQQTRHAGEVPFEGEHETRSRPSAEVEAIGRIEHRAALGLIHQLPADQRDVLLLRVVADLPVEEVALVLNRSADAVRQLHRRALTRLRDVATTELTSSRPTGTTLRWS